MHRPVYQMEEDKVMLSLVVLMKRAPKRLVGSDTIRCSVLVGGSVSLGGQL